MSKKARDLIPGLFCFAYAYCGKSAGAQLLKHHGFPYFLKAIFTIEVVGFDVRPLGIGPNGLCPVLPCPVFSVGAQQTAKSPVAEMLVNNKGTDERERPTLQMVFDSNFDQAHYLILDDKNEGCLVKAFAVKGFDPVADSQWRLVLANLGKETANSYSVGRVNRPDLDLWNHRFFLRKGGRSTSYPIRGKQMIYSCGQNERHFY
jgi:hypothetical protein